MGRLEVLQIKIMLTFKCYFSKQHILIRTCFYIRTKEIHFKEKRIGNNDLTHFLLDLGSECHVLGPCHGIENSKCVPKHGAKATCECSPGYQQFGRKFCIKVISTEDVIQGREDGKWLKRVA